MVKWIQLDVRHMACRLGPVVDESRFPQIVPLQVPSTSTVSPKPLIVGVFKITRSNCEKRRGPEKNRGHTASDKRTIIFCLRIHAFFDSYGGLDLLSFSVCRDIPPVRFENESRLSTMRAEQSICLWSETIFRVFRVTIDEGLK
jgi:hypothetical protein